MRSSHVIFPATYRIHCMEQWQRRNHFQKPMIIAVLSKCNVLGGGSVQGCIYCLFMFKMYIEACMVQSEEVSARECNITAILRYLFLARNLFPIG